MGFELQGIFKIWTKKKRESEIQADKGNDEEAACKSMETGASVAFRPVHQSMEPKYSDPEPEMF